MKRKTNKKWLNEVKQLVGNSYVFLQSYKTTRTKLVYYHTDCGEIHSIAPEDFLRGRRCPTCSRIKRNLKLTKTNKEWIQQVYGLVGDEYKFIDPYVGNHTSIRYKHKVCGKIRTITPANFLAGHRCSYCAGLYEDTFTYKEKIKKLYGNEYSLISEYNKASEMVTIRHNKCNYKWNTNATNFIQGKSHCPKCQESKGEALIKKVLNETFRLDENDTYYYGYVLPNKLHLDFWIPIYRIAIEYDGIQHYQSREFFGGKQEFIKQQIRDRRKDRYCKENNITLVRIPYTVDTFDGVQNILSSYIN